MLNKSKIMLNTLKLPLLVVLFTLGGCVTVPSGPSMLVLPGSGKNFDQFRSDDIQCRAYARDQLGGATPDQAAGDSVARSAIVGTVVGAALGAAVDGSHGAGIGAGTGLAFGGLAGAGAAETSAYGAQQRYDHSYVQCMYAKGHRVPLSGRFVDEPGRTAYPAVSAAPPRGAPPPPPPGNPPPPPPDLR